MKFRLAILGILLGWTQLFATSEVVHRPPMIVVGIECRTSNAPEAAEQDIPAHWARFFSEDVFNQIPNRISDEVIALYCDYEGDYTMPYSLVIGCPVSSADSLPDGMVAKAIPGSSYAKFEAVGDFPQNVTQTWDTIWTTELPRTYTGDFEVYGAKSPQEVEIFIALAD